MEELVVTTADGVCTITLNRPSARNALTSAMPFRIAEAARTADADSEVSVPVSISARSAPELPLTRCRPPGAPTGR
jgi:enoyl-CoA hydratase/carnithine racemase